MWTLTARPKSHPRLFAYATVLVAFFLRAYRLADKNVWWDEGWSVWLSQKDLVWIALRTAADEHPPLHYWLLHFWNFIAGTDAFSGRFISLFFGVLTVALLYRIGIRVGGKWIGVLAALFLTTARFHIWWSQDIKNYTPSIFFAFAAVWFGLNCGWLMTDSKWPKSNHYALYAICYSLFAALAMWTHYLAALVLLALNLYTLCVLLWRKQILNHKSEIINWFLANTLAALLFAPWLYLYLQKAASWSAAPTFDFTLFLKLVATVLPLGVTTNIDNYAVLTIAFTMLAAIPAFCLFAKRSAFRKRNPEYWTLNTGYYFLFVLIVVFPPLLVYALSLTPVSFFAPKIQARYLLILLPAYTILLAFGIALLSRFSRSFAAIAFLALLSANAFVLNHYYADRRLRDEYATLANTINAYARQGDLILLDTDQEWPTLLYYLRYPLDWLGAPNGKPMTADDADTLVRRALTRNDAIWLVAIPDALATDPQKLLEARLARELPKQLERTIDDKRLVLYARDMRDWVTLAPENFAPQYPRAQKIDDTLQLLGFDLPTREINAGDMLRIVTYWRATYPVTTNVRLTGLVTTTLQMPQGNLLRYETDFAIPPTASGEFPLAVGNVELARIQIEPRVSLARAGNISHPTDYRLGESIRLVGYDLPITSYRPGDNLFLTLYWRADRAIENNYTAFAHIVGELFNPKQNNPLWGQIDRVPVPAPTVWLPNETVPDVYRIAIDADTPPGKYKIEIGMYDAATGARMPTADGDSITLAEIEIVR